MCLRNPFAQLISSMAALAVATGFAWQDAPPAPPAPPASPESPVPQSDDQSPPRTLPAEPPPPPPPSSIDPLALRLVQSIGDNIARSQSFTSRITYSFEVRGPAANGDDEGEVETQRATHRLAFQQPNLMRLELVDGEIGETMISDGQSMYIYLPKRNRYVERDAPSDLAGLMQHPGAGFGGPGAPSGLGGPLSFVGMILVPELFDGLAQLLRSGVYLGTEEIDGDETHRIILAIAFPGDTPSPPEETESRGFGEPGEPAPTLDGAGLKVAPVQRQPPAMPELVLHLWIGERGENAVLRRMRIDLARLLAGHNAVPPQLEGYSIDVWISMDEWEFNVDFPEEKFTFDPPEGAQRVETLREVVVDGGDPGPHPLVGRPAPTFELQRLIGTGVDLAEHIGRDVVILDFWATWCTPCIRAMPHLMSVAEEFRDRNVVLYAVNLREDFERVQQFVEERDWESRLKIPMDIDGRVAQEYHVRSIPQTVIIDRQGVVQAVHIGFSPGMEERLRSEVRTLVEGGTLIEEPDDDGEGGLTE